MPIDRRTERRANMKALVIAFGGLAVLALLLWLAGSNAHLFVDTDAKHYGSSLSRAVDGGRGGACGEVEGQGWWYCGVETDAGSGFSATYVLRTEDERCWTAYRADARRVNRSEGGAAPTVVSEGKQALNGCVGFKDYVFPQNPVFGDGSYTPPRKVVLNSQ